MCTNQAHNESLDLAVFVSLLFVTAMLVFIEALLAFLREIFIAVKTLRIGWGRTHKN